jgi:polysaccharide lyase family 4-like protein
VLRVQTVRWCVSGFAAASCLTLLAISGTAQASLGTISGHVVLAGKEPGNPFIRMGVDPKCSALNAGHRVIQESAMIAADGSVANVFVRLDGTFPNTPVPAEPVVIDQRACFYRPRVVGLRVGQVLQIRNDDDLLHNVHSSSAVGNSFNVGQPKAGMVFSFTPKAPEVMLPLACDVHRWMTAYVGIVAHPYFAVSGAGGTFTIAKVPAGTYPIKAWHERFGELTKKVTVKPGAAATIDFSYTTG